MQIFILINNNNMQIHESAQDIEYHYTNLRALKKMMETDTFNMNDVEADKRGGPHMSLTRMRSSRSGYGWGMMNSAERCGEVVIRIELDGRMLNNVRNINVRPYDYNYNEFRDGFDNEGLDFDSETMQMPQRMQILKYTQNGELKSPYNTEEVEAEDSLTLNGDDQITDASNYIRRIDVFLPSHLSESQLALWDIFLRRYLDDYPDWSEKMHFYNDVNAFDYQRDDKELAISSLYRLYKQQYAQSLAENIALTERDIRKMINETIRRIMKRL